MKITLTIHRVGNDKLAVSADDDNAEISMCSTIEDPGLDAIVTEVIRNEEMSIQDILEDLKDTKNARFEME